MNSVDLLEQYLIEFLNIMPSFTIEFSVSEKIVKKIKRKYRYLIITIYIMQVDLYWEFLTPARNTEFYKNYDEDIEETADRILRQAIVNNVNVNCYSELEKI